MSLLTINLNGTSPEELTNQTLSVMEELGEVENALRRATPHPRDYAAPEDYSADRMEFDTMISRVAAIRRWAEKRAERIMEQGGA